ncbi:MAG: hypothetical protein PHV42_03635 [Candidatus Pacebacteria bacterium]|nr:hypothetical protein [Candidatus Paceibacterota bacterium]
MLDSEAKSIYTGETIRTTLEFELERMKQIVANKTKTFRPVKRQDLLSQIYHIFKSSSRVAINKEEEIKIKQVISYYIEKQEPIKVSFLWALFWMSQTPWKFVDYTTVDPRLGDYWMFYWLSLVNNKVSKIFPPGCIFYIIDEYEMVKEMGLTKVDAMYRKSCLYPVYSQFSCIRVIEIPHFSSLPTIEKLNESEVLATILSTPKLVSAIDQSSTKELMDVFYHHGDRDFGHLKSLVPKNIWLAGERIKTKMNQLAAARWTTGWLEKEILGGEPYIDSATTDKGRWSPNAWQFAMPQHGGSVLDYDQVRSHYSICNFPEYRLVGENKPVKIINKDGKEYVFYWLKEPDKNEGHFAGGA